jgi:uncharacterized membrane protein
VRDEATTPSFHPGTAAHEPSPAIFVAADDNSGAIGRLGQAAIVLSGAALLYRAATGRWPVPRAVTRAASDAVATAPIETAVTIAKPRAELYAYWRRLENLPRFMKNLDTVSDLGGGRSHWAGKSPLGFKVEWDAEIVEEREGQLLSWRSLPGAQVHNAGTVFFEDAPGGRGTTVRVSLEFRGAGIGQAVGKALSSVTAQQVHEDVRRFKRLMETGEIATTDGQPHGERSLIGRLHNPL